MDMTVTGGGARSLITVTRSLLRARASTLHQLTGWLTSSGGHRGHISVRTARLLEGSGQIGRSLLTGRLDVQPAGPFDLPAEEEVLQAGGVGAKHVGEGRPLQVGGQRIVVGLREQQLPQR